jgi:hypothetical protein
MHEIVHMSAVLARCDTYMNTLPNLTSSKHVQARLVRCRAHGYPRLWNSIELSQRARRWHCPSCCKLTGLDFNVNHGHLQCLHESFQCRYQMSELYIWSGSSHCNRTVCSAAPTSPATSSPTSLKTDLSIKFSYDCLALCKQNQDNQPVQFGKTTANGQEGCCLLSILSSRLLVVIKGHTFTRF